MAQEKPNALTEWLHAMRAQIPVQREHLGHWFSAVREEPGLVWATPTVRYSVYGLGGVLLLVFASYFSGMIAPPRPAGSVSEATTADFHVVCSDETCEHHFVIHRRFGFRRFPVECPKCQQHTGARAQRCNSSTCLGRWIAPQDRDGVLSCPQCGRSVK